MRIELDTYRDFNLPPLLRRRVDVWLPPQYHENPDQRYSVLYMHDGQNLFYRKKFILRTWKVAEHITTLSRQGTLTPAIVVGIWNTSNRMGDYLPYKPFRSEAARAALEAYAEKYDVPLGVRVSDVYLKLIVEHIKPKMDATYRTLVTPENTAMMGSSMGGLISLYALCEYPQVFGMAGCISTHWPICGEAMPEYLEESLPPARLHKLYFDHGTLGFDKYYGPYQEKVDAIMRAKGYTEGVDWVTKVFPGDDHNEVAWSGRLQLPLTFMFGVYIHLPLGISFALNLVC